MGNVEIVGDQNQPTSVITYTKSGNEIDLNNLPGFRKIQLIKQGEMHVDQFVTPPNMPGRKLKALREAHRAKVEEQMKALEKPKKVKEENKEETFKQFAVGDFVTFRDGSHEILKTRDNAVLLHIKVKEDEEAKDVWVPKKKVEKG